MIGIRVASAFAAILLALLLSAQLRPTDSMRDPDLSLERSVPQRFGTWQIDPAILPLAPTPELRAKLDEIYDQTLSRTYVNASGERVMMSIAYGGDQTDALRAHRQEACYRANGFTIRNLHHEEVVLLGRPVPVVRMHAVRGVRSEPVTYWMTMGERVVWGRDERMVTQVLYGLRGKIPDGMLVRVSSLDADPAAAYRLQQAFLGELLTFLSDDVVTRFVGPVPAGPSAGRAQTTLAARSSVGRLWATVR